MYSSSWSEHLDSLREVFSRLVCASLTLNLAKCEFGKGTVTYLGRQVGQGQVRPIEEKVRAITEFPVPTTRRELRRFLGMTGYYRTFCRNFSEVVHPLTNLTGPKVPFLWTPECQRAFSRALKLSCATLPSLLLLTLLSLSESRSTPALSVPVLFCCRMIQMV